MGKEERKKPANELSREASNRKWRKGGVSGGDGKSKDGQGLVTADQE